MLTGSDRLVLYGLAAIAGGVLLTFVGFRNVDDIGGVHLARLSHHPAGPQGSSVGARRRTVNETRMSRHTGELRRNEGDRRLCFERDFVCVWKKVQDSLLAAPANRQFYMCSP